MKYSNTTENQDEYLLYLPFARSIIPQVCNVLHRLCVTTNTMHVERTRNVFQTF